MNGGYWMHDRSTVAHPEPHTKLQMTPDIDVIILSLDRVEDTIAAIDSALTQRGVIQKVWIVDQGSSTDTLERLQRYAASKPTIHLEITGRNLGVPGGRNLASRLGCAPYIVALDNDAVFSSDDELAKVVRRMEGDRGIAAIGFRILNFYSRGDDERSWGYPKSLKSRPDQEFLSTCFVGTGHALRRDAFERVGGYDDTLFFCWEELDISYRLINRGYHIIYAPEVAIYHKVSPQHRINWEGGRYCYYVRNRVYIEYKYGVSHARLMILAGAYTLKGIYNGVGAQAFRAIVEASSMCWHYYRNNKGRGGSRLSADARQYIFDNDQRYRGSLWRRLRLELFAKLPGTM